MIKRSKGLGKGLEALLGPSSSSSPSPSSPSSEISNALNATLQEVDIALLVPGPYQPRTQMDEASLQELAESIKSQGVIQPILVRKVQREEGERWEIIAGERRYRACRMAQLERVPILERVINDESAAIVALIENIQRENLNPLEEANGIQKLTQTFGLTHDEAAQALGRSRSTTSNLLRLLQLTPPVQAMLMAGDIEMGHARALLTLEEGQQIALAYEVSQKQLSVRETEKLVQRRKNTTPTPTPTTTPSSSKNKDPEIRRIEHELSDLLTTQVEIKTAAKGAIHVRFSSIEGFNQLMDYLRRHDSSLPT